MSFPFPAWESAIEREAEQLAGSVRGPVSTQVGLEPLQSPSRR